MTQPANNSANPPVTDSVAALGVPTRAQRGRKKAAAAASTTANWLFFFTAVCLIVLAVLLLLARMGLPWFGNYKGEIEARLSERLRSPVVIDDLSIRWEQFGPKLSATNVSLSEATDRLVTLDEVLIDINFLKSLSRRQPVIDELTLVGARLALETSPTGKFELHGLKRSAQESTEPRQSVDLLAWLMTTKRVGLRNATITLINAPDNESVTINDLNIVAINKGALHQLRVDMMLPEQLGGAVELGIDLIGDSQDIRNASVALHLKASDLKVDAWRSLQASRIQKLRTSTTGIARLDATMQLELWGSMSEGRLQSARGQLLATDLIDLISQKKVLDSITTDLVFKNMTSGWQLSSDVLELQNGDDLTSINNVAYHYKPAANTAWQLDANGQSLEIDVATKLLLSLFDKDADLPRAKWIAGAQPSGDLSDWNAQFGLVDGKPDFSLVGRFNDLELAAASGVPGAKNISGAIDMQNNIGTLSLQGTDIELDLPVAYEKPLQLQQFYAELDMDATDPLHTSIKGDISIDDAGLHSNTRIEVKLDPRSSPHIYTQGQFSLDDIGQATRYLPIRLLKPKTTSWLNAALVAGKAVNGELLMFGHVADYPFKENEGVFDVGFDIEDATLNFLESWPYATKLQGRVDMEGSSLRGTATDGLLDAMRFTHVDARIDDFLNPVLALSSTGAGSLASMIEFANTGPLKKILSPALSDVTATGSAQMDLSITVPLKRPASDVNTVASAQASSEKVASVVGLEINGSVFLKNNDLSFARSKLDLTKVDGAVGFTHDGIRVDNLQALKLGRPVRVDVKTDGRGSARTTRLKMVGPMRADAILDTYDIPLKRFVNGESQWTTVVDIPMTAAGMARNGIKVAAVSNMIGTAIVLPEPLGKPVGTDLRLALSSTIKTNNDTPTWSVDYGDVMRARVLVGDEGLQSFSARFGGGAPNPNVDEGFRLEGKINALGLDGWARSIAALLEDLTPATSPTPIMPISAELQVRNMIAGAQYVGSGTLRFNTDSDYINAVIDNQWISGSVRYPRVHWRQDRPALVRLTSVDKRFIDALGTAPEADEPGNELDPRTLPPIQARIGQLRWDLLDLKDFTIRTSPAVSGLNIDTFGFAYESAQLIGEGYWRLRDPQGVNGTLADEHVTKLDLTLQGDDFGSLLTHIGFGGTLNEGEGIVSGSIAWPAPAYKPSLENLLGDVDIDLKKGRILKVDPGAVKLAGLFALEAIPRRLSFDFKDMVLDGLDYETIRGNVQLANGIAHASLVQLNSSVGVLDITGESNLITQQYNQRLTVLPRVSSALPIIGIITGGATAGIGALFAGGLLKAIGLDFDRIGLRDYTLKGSWDAPEFTQVPFTPAAQ